MALQSRDHRTMLARLPLVFVIARLFDFEQKSGLREICDNTIAKLV
jgi:hypothetical protein